MYSYKDGRVWLQRNKFETYDLLLPYGMTGITDPAGGLTAVREPDPAKRRQSVIADVLRGEPGLPEFQLETRLQRTLNYLMSDAIKTCAANFQVHMGRCDRADNYLSSEIALHWERSHRGDLGIDRLSIVEGDDAPDAVTVPFSSEVGPLLLDFGVEFLSARDITEDQLLTGIAMLDAECFEDCQSQEDAGKNGYASANAAGGAAAEVHYTTNKGETWTAVSANPFGNDENISGIAVLGSKAKHRVIALRGTTDGANPAEIAYADVTVIGTTSWVNVDVGSTTGEYINCIYAPNYREIFVGTDQGNIYRSKDGGLTWELKRTGNGSEPITDIRGVSYGRNAGLVVGVGGNDVVISQDRGENWDVVAVPGTLYSGSWTALEVTPDGTIYVGDDAGNFVGSIDIGDNWSDLSLAGITPAAINSIRSWGDSIIWVAANIAGPSGRVLRSTDGGASFNLWSLNMPTNTGVQCLAPVDLNRLFVGGAAGFLTKTRTNIDGLA